MEVRVTLTVHHIRVLAFTSNEPNIKLVSAFLLHLNHHCLAAPASRLDRHNVSMHDAVITSSEGCNRQGAQARAVIVCLPRHTLRRLSAASIPEGEAQDDDDVVALRSWF